MKTLKLIAISIILLCICYSCDKDEVEKENLVLEEIENESIPKGPTDVEADSVALDITLETLEDQMGSFWDNGIVEFNDKVWAIAGYNGYGENCTDAVWNSDDGVNWRSVAYNGFGARRAHATAVFGDKIWVIGGVNTDVDPWVEYDDVWSSTDGENWIRELEHAPFGHMFYPTLTIFNNKLFLIGRARSSTTSPSPTQVWSSSDGTNWNLEVNNPFPEREGHKTLVFQDQLYVIGGMKAGTDYDDVWSSDDGINWLQVTRSGDLFDGRHNHGAVVYDDKIWVFGGSGIYISGHADLFYSSNGSEWHEYTDLGPDPDILTNFGFLNYNGAIWVFGGFKPGDPRLGAGPTGEIVSLRIRE